jgi:hypothetical protein
VRSASSDDFVSRHSRPFFISPMPEIWDDSNLTAHFVSSFFEGLLGAHLKGGKGARLHVQRVLAACCEYVIEDEPPLDADGLAKGFRRYLRVDGWSDLNWR